MNIICNMLRVSYVRFNGIYCLEYLIVRVQVNESKLCNAVNAFKKLVPK